MKPITGNWKKNFDYRFISSDDLEGREVELVIKEVGVDEAFNSKTNKKEPVMVLTFEGKEKMMICNKTNAKTISKWIGSPRVENWKGATITLYPAPWGDDFRIVVKKAVRNTKTPAPSIQFGEGGQS